MTTTQRHTESDISQSSEITLSTRHGRLNALGCLNSASRYLEIGVHKAKTLRNITIKHKTAVDPKFEFEKSDLANQTIDYHEVTSDTFFALGPQAIQPFDVIYLDGLHIYDQTLKDLLNSLQYSHAKTLILIDDTIPVSFMAAERDQSRVRFARQFVPHEDKQWMGDVFKVIPFINDYLPNLDWITFPGHGQTVVFQRNRATSTPHFNCISDISEMDYIDFLKCQQSGLYKIAPTNQHAITTLNQFFNSPTQPHSN